MSIKSLSMLALEKLTVGKAKRCNAKEMSVVAMETLKAVEKSDTLDLFKTELEAVNGHPCALENLVVWHGALKPGRKYRKETDCLGCCKRAGKCECWCGAILWKLIEYREAEIFRGIGKQPKKVIKNGALVGDIIYRGCGSNNGF